MEQVVKLTVRIPHRLHALLRQHAQAQARSLNKTIVEALWLGLSEAPCQELSEREKTLRLIRERGLWEPLGPGWEKYTMDAPKITHAELREELQGVPPLSKVIIEERGPR